MIAVTLDFVRARSAVLSTGTVVSTFHYATNVEGVTVDIDHATWKDGREAWGYVVWHRSGTVQGYADNGLSDAEAKAVRAIRSYLGATAVPA